MCDECGGTGDAVCVAEGCGELATHRLHQQREWLVCDEHYEEGEQ